MDNQGENVMDEDYKIAAGKKKKSMSLYFNNGEIWFEHLDSLGSNQEYLKQKFQNDLPMIKRPSGSAYVCVNLDETEVNSQILEFILYTFRDMEKLIRKVAFVGLNRQGRKSLKELIKNSDVPISFLIKCFNDYQLSKEWLIP